MGLLDKKSFIRWLQDAQTHGGEIVQALDDPEEKFSKRASKEDNWYLIRPGARGVRYTLRVLYWQHRPATRYSGGGRDLKNTYVATLGSEDYSRMLAKAKRLAGKSPLFFERRSAGNEAASAQSTTTLRKGKYKDQDWGWVLDNDPPYAAWLAYGLETEGDKFRREMKLSKAFAEHIEKTAPQHAETAKELQRKRDQQAAYLERKAERERRRQSLTERAAPIIKSSKHAGREGAQINVGAVVESVKSFEAPAFGGYYSDTVFKYVYTMISETGNVLTYITSNGPWRMKGKVWAMAHEAHGLPVFGETEQGDEYEKIREMRLPFESQSGEAALLRPGAVICVRGRIKRLQTFRYKPFEGAAETLLTRATIRAYRAPGSSLDGICDAPTKRKKKRHD